MTRPDRTHLRDPVLGAVLEGCGIDPMTAEITGLQGGRTNAVWRVDRTGALPPLVVKLSTPSARNPLFDNRPQDEWRMLLHLSPSGVAPGPLHCRRLDDGRVALIYEFVDGAHAAMSAAELAALLRRVHKIGPLPGLPTFPMSAEALHADADRFLTGLAPLPLWAKNLRPKTCDHPEDHPGCLLHRDAIGTNLVRSSAGELVLLDWQCPGIGHACEDVAHATSPAMAQVYQMPCPPSAVEVIDAYPADDKAAFQRLLPVLRWRMMCYCHWQVCQGQSSYAAAMEAEARDLERLQSQDNHER